MLIEKKLKIQFRAVIYTGTTHVLEWRIDPNQDLIYYTYHHFLFFQWKRKHKYDTKWHQPVRFFNHLHAEEYGENDDANWYPYWIHKQSDLDEYKNKFKTVGEFLDFQEKDIKTEKEKWELNRQNYLAKRTPWY